MNEPIIFFQKRGKVEDEYCEIWAIDTTIVVAKEGKLPLQLIRPPYHANPNLAVREGVFSLWSVLKPRLPIKKDESNRYYMAEPYAAGCSVGEETCGIESGRTTLFVQDSIPQKRCS